MSGDAPLIVPPEWSSQGLPSPQEVARMTSRLDELRVERKAAERAFVVPGGDFVWWEEKPPARVWAVDGVTVAVNPAPRPGLCGYALLPPKHPWRAEDLVAGDVDVEVHGGVTWQHDVTGWIGFDTGHYRDCWTDAELERAREAGLVGEQSWARWQEVIGIERAHGLGNLACSSEHLRPLHWSWEAVVAETVVLAAAVRSAW